MSKFRNALILITALAIIVFAFTACGRKGDPFNNELPTIAITSYEGSDTLNTEALLFQQKIYWEAHDTDGVVDKYAFAVVDENLAAFTDDDGRQDNQRAVYLPISTAQKALATIDRINTLAVTVASNDVSDSKRMEDEIRKDIAERHVFDEKDKNAMFIWNAVEEFKQFQDLFAAIRLFIWIIGVGTIVAGIVGVSNIMMISVKERTREIGIRKSLGATPRSIVSMIMQEALLITGLSGYIGLVLGIGVLELVNPYLQSEFFRNPEADLRVAISALVVLVIAGMLAGFVPARRAAAIKPVEALKEE